MLQAVIITKGYAQKRYFLDGNAHAEGGHDMSKGYNGLIALTAFSVLDSRVDGFVVGGLWHPQYYQVQWSRFRVAVHMRPGWLHVAANVHGEEIQAPRGLAAR